MVNSKPTEIQSLWTYRVENNFSEDQPMLRVNSNGHVLHAYVNGDLVGMALCLYGS